MPTAGPEGRWAEVKRLAILCLLLIAFNSCGRDDKRQSSASFRFPLEEYSVFQEFCHVNVRYDSRYHCGEDATGNGGTPVYAVADGEVSYSGPGGGYGWLIVVYHPAAGVYSLYGHLSTRRDKIQHGEIKKGQLIGYLADNDEDGSGDGYPEWGPHLHFAIRKGRVSDYPDSGDERWGAGYTSGYPPDIGWLDPTDFIERHSD